MIPTPICDFVTAYAASAPARFHMPGHKGVTRLGCEQRDITELSGADDLYHASGIIAESEAIASRLFGCPTVYSAEGSSLCIRGMLYLAYTRARCRGRLLAGRNAHKSLLNTAILLDFPIGWLWAGQDYLSCPITPAQVEAAILAEPETPFAVYLTSPDYLGNVSDIRGIAGVCHAHGVPLLVDNAHGAYLRFLPESRHPMDLGVDLCCDSAHKTLPVLTGGAYLHFREEALRQSAKDAMALFGSTSPSYLILQSLDLCNPYLEGLPQALSAFAPQIAALKGALLAHGFSLVGQELLKLTLATNSFGYTGEEVAAILEKSGCYCEFCDPDYIVFMFTPENTPETLEALRQALCAIPRREALPRVPLSAVPPEAPLTPRAAALAPRETVPAEESLGRILANATVGCPPAVPIVMCGERIDRHALAAFRRYGLRQVTVVKGNDTETKMFELQGDCHGSVRTASQ